MFRIIKTYYKIIIWVIVIAFLCFTPGNDLQKIKIPIPHFDKLVHFTMFYILGLLISGKKNSLNVISILWLYILAVIYGGIIEIVQLNWIYMRSGDVVDWLFDLIGLLLAWKTFAYYPLLLQKGLK